MTFEQQWNRVIEGEWNWRSKYLRHMNLTGLSGNLQRHLEGRREFKYLKKICKDGMEIGQQHTFEKSNNVFCGC
jgi:hypothetical protein